MPSAASAHNHARAVDACAAYVIFTLKVGPTNARGWGTAHGDRMDEVLLYSVFIIIDKVVKGPDDHSSGDILRFQKRGRQSFHQGCRIAGGYFTEAFRPGGGSPSTGRGASTGLLILMIFFFY